MGKTKSEKVAYRTREDKLKKSEPSFRKRMHEKEPEGYFIGHAIKNPGRVRTAIHKEFGIKAFNNDGTIREEYLKKGIKHAKKVGNVDLERAELLAKRLKGFRKEAIA